MITKDEILKIKKKTKEFTVLIVDDDATTLTYISATFEQFDFKQIDKATNGKDALNRYKNYFEMTKKNYDFILSDINMPIMNGVELIKEIKKINDTQEILVMSAYDDFELLKTILNLGVSSYIHKPLKFDELAEYIGGLSQKIDKDRKAKDDINETLNLNKELVSLMNGYNSMSIASRTDRKGIITYVSNKFLEITGFSKEELIGKTHSVLKHPKTPNKIFNEIWDTISSGHVWKGKIRNLTKDGKEFWTNTTIGPYFDEEKNILGYNSIREEITAQVNTEKLYEKIDLILSNVDEGFLLFNKNFNINRSYSLKCEDIFSAKNIETYKIYNLLFRNLKERNLFKKTIEYIFEAKAELEKDLYISLLPKKVFINDKHISISYKVLENQLVLLILKDITITKALEDKLEVKKTYQKMIISIVSNTMDFISIKEDFDEFLNRYFKSPNYIKIPKIEKAKFIKELHTFKGLFSQKNFVYTPKTIHELETKLNEIDLKDYDNIKLFSNENILISFHKDLDIIKKMLGDEYITEQEKLNYNTKILIDIKDKISQIINQPKHMSFNLQTIASNIESMTYLNVYNILNSHNAYIDDLSIKLNKPMNKLIIIGDKDLSVPPHFLKFFRNLIHLYRNTIDHGIEDENIRVFRKKEDKGTIICKYSATKSLFTLEISDDGNGIDIRELRKKLLEKHIIKKDELEKLDEEKILSTIFYEMFSTKSNVDNISGRGIGTSSLKTELTNLNGIVDIINSYKKGLSFKFRIPIYFVDKIEYSKEFLDKCLEIEEIIVERMKNFLINELKLDILDSRYCNRLSFKNKTCSFIEFFNNKRYLFCISYSEPILKSIMEKIPVMQVANMNILDFEIKEDIANEFTNTIIGLSCQDFPEIDSSSVLGVPYILDESKTYERHYNLNYKSISNIIQTNAGNIQCSMLVDN